MKSTQHFVVSFRSMRTPILKVLGPFFCACFIVFYFMSHDPFFLVLTAIVALGVIWAGFSYVMDKQSKSG
jgi:hypothetical protein